MIREGCELEGISNGVNCLSGVNECVSDRNQMPVKLNYYQCMNILITV